jgi:hypothetical protein
VLTSTAQPAVKHCSCFLFKCRVAPGVHILSTIPAALANISSYNDELKKVVLEPFQPPVNAPDILSNPVPQVRLMATYLQPPIQVRPAGSGLHVSWAVHTSHGHVLCRLLKINLPFAAKRSTYKVGCHTQPAAYIGSSCNCRNHRHHECKLS